MSKIICDVCGTTYPETASQCPICGCAKPGAPTADSASEGGERTYTFVKGGRFSKSNVRKRNKESSIRSYEEEEDDDYGMEFSEPTSNKGLVIAVILLIIAIAAVVAYIMMHLSNAPNVPSVPLPTGASTSATLMPEQTQPTTEATEPDLSCTQLTLDETSVTLYNIGSAYLIHSTALPENTTDPITYTSADTLIAEVNGEGRVTAVAPGTTVIHVSCGTQTVDFTVNCEIGPDPSSTYAMHINGEDVEERRFKNDVTLPAGGSFRLELVNVETDEVMEVEWEIGNTNVCTMKGNLVVYVGPGSTRVKATIGDKTYECLVSCS